MERLAVCLVFMICFALTLVAPDAVAGQVSDKAIPAVVAPSYKIDLARHYFASPEAEEADRAALERLYGALEKLKGELATSPQSLSKALDLYEQATVAYIRHENYLFLRAALNTEDRRSAEANRTLVADYESRTAFVRHELGEIDTATWSKFVTMRPDLERYEFAIKDARRVRDHRLALEEEELLLGQAPLAVGWQYDLYEELVRGRNFGVIETQHGPVDVLKSRREIAADADAGVRESGFKKLYAGFAADSDLYAFVLRNLAHARNVRAQLRRFDDNANASYFNSYWAKTEVSNVLTALAEHVDIYKSYEKERARRAGLVRHLEDVNVWDVSGALSDSTAPPFSFRKLKSAAPIRRPSNRPLWPTLSPDRCARPDSRTSV